MKRFISIQISGGKMRKLMLMIFAIVLSLWETSAHAQGKICQWLKKGGDVPVPYSIINRTVELAPGAYYALQGKVHLINRHPFLQVDLEKHSWLANPRRKEDPLYPLVEGQVDWEKLDFKEVRIVLRAEGQVVVRTDAVDGDREFGYDLILEPMSYPLVVDDEEEGF